jgi:cytochrome P450
MEDQSGSRRGINVSEHIVSLTYTVVSRAVFGNKLGGMDPRSFRAMTKEVADLLETVAVSDMFPRLRWVDWAMGLDASIKRTASKLDDVLERTLQAHEKSLENDVEAGGDLLDDLLSAVKEGGDGFMLDRIDVKGLVLVSPKD